MDGKSNISKRGSVGFHPFMLRCYFMRYATILYYATYHTTYVLFYNMFFTRTAHLWHVSLFVSHTLCHYVTQHNLCYVTTYDMAQHNLYHT